MLELTDISGPLVLQHLLNHLLVDLHARAFVFFGVDLNEMLSEKRNIIDAFAQRRDPDLYGIYPVKQVLTEFFLL